MVYIDIMYLFFHKKTLFKVTLFFFFSLLFADDNRPPLTVAAVQMRINIDMYQSEEAFWTAIEVPLSRAEGEGADLVVFPEYLGVFYSLMPYASLLGEASGIDGALSLLSRQRERMVTPFDLFIAQGTRVEQAVERWVALSREYGVSIVAGSFFVPHDGGGKTLELRNRAFIISPDHGLVYYQDKVFLTDFERDICGLSAGQVVTSGFDLQGRRIVMTLCRDTFFPVWEQAFEGEADLWIDIKANGTAFDTEQEEIFMRALPARLPGAQIPYGLTVCLTGRYLDLYWEGRSSLINYQAGRVVTVLESKTVNQEELLLFQIP